MLKAFGAEMESVEADVLAKGLTLSADEAAAFWPPFKRYQAERTAIMNGQIEAIRAYAENYATQTDENGVAYVNAPLDRDQKIHELRVKYLAGQAKLASAIPLVR